MEPQQEKDSGPQAIPANVSRRSASRSALSVVDRLVVTAVAAAIIGLGSFGVYNAAVPAVAPAPEQDSVTDQQARERARAFNGAPPLELRRVGASEMTGALASMKLPAEEKQRLIEALAAPSAETPAPTAVSSGSPVRLAWITLWDTDAQDGDQVRLDSNGFSTVVVLANTPVTFAIPVPEQGVVNLTGVHDGGGGITIGAMSGAQRVALPIMSVGQVLGVPVSAR